jgi:hypothetical protein
MAKFSFNMQIQAIVVGNPSDEFVRHSTNVLKNYELEFSVCPDVYQAVSQLAKTNGNVLIVGRIEQLSRENGRFFRIAGKKKSLVLLSYGNKFSQAVSAKSVDDRYECFCYK